MTKAITDASTQVIAGNNVEVVSSVISADDFFDIVSGYEEEYPIAPGKHALIRSLTYPEVKHLAKTHKGDDSEIELAALITGTVFPQLTEEHKAKLRGSAAGPLMNMAKRIMVISGMVDDEKNLGEGGGSS